jgi:hypothetical protein
MYVYAWHFTFDFILYLPPFSYIYVKAEKEDHLKIISQICSYMWQLHILQ